MSAGHPSSNKAFTCRSRPLFTASYKSAINTHKRGISLAEVCSQRRLNVSLWGLGMLQNVFAAGTPRAPSAPSWQTGGQIAQQTNGKTRYPSIPKDGQVRRNSSSIDNAQVDATFVISFNFPR